ncbi:hypothetical protein [Burkholderia contaminans]|nr:hypothetical protein [Burkholderia contaminans]
MRMIIIYKTGSATGVSVLGRGGYALAGGAVLSVTLAWHTHGVPHMRHQ